MAEHLNVIPEDLRTAAREHRDAAERLGTASAAHAGIMASLDSLGPVFGELRDAGRRLLDQRRICYQQQAAAHADLADKLGHAADVWERHDIDAAGQLRTLTEDSP